MEQFITLILIIVVFCLPGWITNYKFNNRTSPNGYKTDYSAMNRDFAMGKSKTEVKQKFNSGGYDIPDK